MGTFTWDEISTYPAEGHLPSVACGLWSHGTTLTACPGAVLQGVKEGGEKPRGARMADKAGWIKKSSGGFLGLWKDRYLLLCQAQLLVYENEVRTCLGLRLGVWGRGQSEGSLSPQEDPRTGAGRRVPPLPCCATLGQCLIFSGSLQHGHETSRCKSKAPG